MSISMFFEIYPGIYLVSMALLGLAIGSFLNVVIYRLPIMMETDWKDQCRVLLDMGPATMEKQTYNIITPRSRCPQCEHPIPALHNIPVLSYLILGGRCGYCKHKISIRYPLVELMTGILTVFIAWKFGFTLQTLFICLFTWALICLSLIDIDKQLLPDDITLPFIWIGLGCNLFGIFTDIQSSVIGAMLGYVILWCIFIIFKTLTGKEGMGYGDFKLLSMMGAWMGWQILPLIILISSLAGSVIGILLILFRHQDKNVPIPFGPYLAISGWISLIWGDQIISFYMQYI